jgi:hypothetical protein
MHLTTSAARKTSAERVRLAPDELRKRRREWGEKQRAIQVWHMSAARVVMREFVMGTWRCPKSVYRTCPVVHIELDSKPLIAWAARDSIE